MDQNIAIINADCPAIMSAVDLETLKTNFENYSWDGLSTFKLIIPFDPVYKMIQSSYRAQYRNQVNDYREDVGKLENYLPIVSIETLSYLDYLGEKIYSCIKQEPLDSEEEESEFEKAEAKDLYKLMAGIEKYLEKNTIDDNEAVREKVIQLKFMSDVAQRYNLEILFIDEYF